MEEIKQKEGGLEMEKDFEKIAQENLANWFTALHTGDPEKMREIYLSGCTFFPTLDPNLRKGTDAAVDYFANHFMPKNPFGKKLSTSESIDKISEDEIFHVGHYVFEIDGEKDQRKTVPARFVFRWKKTTDRKWGILHHSSDKLPETH